MADRCQSLRMKRTETAQSAGINYVIDVANSNDRFKLLEDDAVLPADLTNPVHPIFRQLEGEKQLHLALQLASQFLLHDRLLEFFVPLLFGRESFDLQHEKAYLNNPLVRASKAKQAQLLSAVREALQCLARRIEVCFVDHKKQRLYARTIANGVEPKVTSSCCRVFQQEVSPKIEVTDKFLQYYNSEDGYRKASWCARYRHDFLVATTLVHEVVHAVGVMRRGNLTEPHYQHDFPETEWGYAWENFMFGSIINPQDKTHLGTHLLMRKVWANARLADANGGKEYCDVPVSWIAQWFQNKTWDIVAKKGPTAIALPTTHFKIQISNELGAWVMAGERRVEYTTTRSRHRNCKAQAYQFLSGYATGHGGQASQPSFRNCGYPQPKPKNPLRSDHWVLTSRFTQQERRSLRSAALLRHVTLANEGKHTTIIQWL
ncbi:hypothetical protein ST47_g2149 [Ascochyta rabiei]|uniref:Uncharacterized protein n=1 Tax=Didymella rabiei TaxID=5454 RepID=A0A163K0U0_DIDRA|nr:hypothetical protein ST47_g2149 [Ascochyta rabiei]